MALEDPPEGTQWSAVKVDPENGYLFAAVPLGDIDPLAVVVSFLDSVDPDTLEDEITRQAEPTMGRNILAALRKFAQETP